MPACFSLTRKGEERPVDLVKLDAELREHFKQPQHDTEWLWGWYDSIGLACAVGKTWEQQRDIFKDWPEELRVIDYLEENFEVDCWSQW